MEKEKNIKILKNIIDTYEFNIKQYQSKAYDEANTRTDFIDKFFECLEWDVRNNQNFAEQYRQVVREDKVKIQGKQKAPDYSFRIYGQRKFFVEAKKPAININNDAESAYQIRRYGYTAKLSLSILTNFGEFAVYDTRIKPNKNDTPSTARIIYYTYKEYLDNFDKIYELFSINSILKGSFDKYVIENKSIKGTSEVDREFLKVIDEWRIILAKNIAKNNKNITIEELNYAVQKIIDRIIFLRIAEDRETEEYKQLDNITNQKDIYPKLDILFKKAFDKYNSNIFKIEKFIEKLKIDDNIFKQIVKNMYYPDSPYEFSVLPIEILGNIYEQFLGKTITFTKSHNAKIEEKIDIRKAGGVYYTPQYIVDYIIRQTIENKIKTDDIKNLKIIDISCGSGSFLIRAYDYLLKYHLNEYTKNKTNINKAIKENKIYPIGENDYKLTIKEKQNILMNNIYGVDIDLQAVEVTKLSLLLKLMEDERKQYYEYIFNIDTSFKLLPDLSENIKCGNSLIDSKIYDIIDITNINDSDIKKINPFNWQEEFSEIIKNGGFDIVIGNPPYVRQEKIEHKKFLVDNYETGTGTADIYIYFYEKAIQLLKQNGCLGFITSNKWMRTRYGQKLRTYLKNKTNIKNIIDFSGYKIFEDATVDVNIIIVSKTSTDNNIIKTVTINNEFNKEGDINKYFDNISVDLPQNNLDVNCFALGSADDIKLKQKIENAGVPLKDWNDININYGIKTGYNKAFIIDTETKNKLCDEDPNSAEIIKPILRGRDIKRYSYNWSGLWLINTHNGYDGIPPIDIKNYPAIKKYLDLHKDKLKKRWDKGVTPYNLRHCAYIKEFEKEKIVWKQTSSLQTFIYDDNNYYLDVTSQMLVGNNLKYMLTCLNSKLINFVFRKISYSFGKKGTRWIPEFMYKIPIPQITDDNIAIVNELESLCDAMIDAHNKLAESRTPSDIKLYNNKISIIDSKIDKLVYSLYGLNEADISLIEDSG